MPPPFRRHVFVCTNRRPEGSPKGCCASKGSEEVRLRLKSAVESAGLSGEVRVNASGCLDACEQGVAVVVYPEGVWYSGVSLADVDELVREHLVGERPMERLRMKPFSRG
ncbi:MAG: (2Fe-2S) ferredoxin domain-containing protein [Myxococcota bacterium]